MKLALISLTSLYILLAGCSSSKDTMTEEKMKVVSATFEQWSDPPPAGSDIPERGTDLTITVRNWPQSYSPKYVVFNKRKSLSVSIADSSANQATIKARIVQASSMLAETSESINVSDRLVFTRGNGNTNYIEIESWQRTRK